MKKVVAILAVVVVSVGFYSCEKDNSVEDTQALYETLETSASDTHEGDGSRGGN